MWGTINKKTKQLVGINFQSNDPDHFKAELKLCPCCRGDIFIPKKVKDLLYGKYSLARFRKEKLNRWKIKDFNSNEYYMICPDCGSNNLVQDNWCAAHLLDFDSIIKCNDCGAKYEELEMYIVVTGSDKL